MQLYSRPNLNTIKITNNKNFISHNFLQMISLVRMDYVNRYIDLDIHNLDDRQKESNINSLNMEHNENL